MNQYWSLVLLICLLTPSTVSAGPWGALAHYNRMMNPNNCPTWALAEVDNLPHSHINLEHYAFDHYLDDQNKNRITYAPGCIDRFASFSSTDNRSKSPSFFLIWLRSKLLYEPGIKVAHYVFQKGTDEAPAMSFYTLIGRKTRCKISEAHDQQYLVSFPRYELYEINGAHVGNEFFREVDEGKLNPILEDFFLGRKTYLEDCRRPR